MLDWMFIIFFIIAIFFIILSIMLPEEEAFWKILFVVLPMILFFVLALSNLEIETAYQTYNSTTGNVEVAYDKYVSESNTYMSYFYMLMGSLCGIYLVILVFQDYYDYMERKDKEKYQGFDEE